jgi:hypothetical protein
MYLLFKKINAHINKQKKWFLIFLLFTLYKSLISFKEAKEIEELYKKILNYQKLISAMNRKSNPKARFTVFPLR